MTDQAGQKLTAAISNSFVACNRAVYEILDQILGEIFDFGTGGRVGRPTGNKGGELDNESNHALDRLLVLENRENGIEHGFEILAKLCRESRCSGYELKLAKITTAARVCGGCLLRRVEDIRQTLLNLRNCQFCRGPIGL